MPYRRKTNLVAISKEADLKLTALAKIFKKQKKQVVELLVNQCYEETFGAGLTDAYIIKSLGNGHQRVRIKLGE